MFFQRRDFRFFLFVVCPVFKVTAPPIKEKNLILDAAQVAQTKFFLKYYTIYLKKIHKYLKWNRIKHIYYGKYKVNQIKRR